MGEGCVKEEVKIADLKEKKSAVSSWVTCALTLRLTLRMRRRLEVAVSMSCFCAGQKFSSFCLCRPGKEMYRLRRKKRKRKHKQQSLVLLLLHNLVVALVLALHRADQRRGSAALQCSPVCRHTGVTVKENKKRERDGVEM